MIASSHSRSKRPKSKSTASFKAGSTRAIDTGDEIFAELITDNDALKRKARRRRGLKEPAAIFWDFWN